MNWNRGTSPSGQPPESTRQSEPFVLPSRRNALDACRAALGLGPVLITGEAGIGKTWLASQLADESGAPRSWVTIDLTPSLRPRELLQAIAHGLGLEPAATFSARDPRLELAETLAERAADGVATGLVIDEVHVASGDVLEELRVLSNRLGRPDGFAAMVLIGQTALGRRIGLRPLAALEARLGRRVHLRPLDLDEAREFLDRQGLGTGITPPELELLHRDSGGNPRRLLRRVAALMPLVPRSLTAAREPTPVPSRETPLASPPSAAAMVAPLLPSKPPLYVEDGLIEVGWDAEPESPAPSSSSTASDRPTRDEPAEEVIDDHYAALQAWNEWTRNQGRRTTGESIRTTPSTGPKPASRIEPPAASDERASSSTSRANVWVEGQQAFAPYSQLFSRARQSKDKEG